MDKSKISIIFMLIFSAFLLVNCGNTDEAYNDGYLAGEQAGYSSGYEKGQSDGYDRGLEYGLEQGYTQGYGEGYDTGHTEGHEQGYESGLQDGRTEGRELGYEEGYQKGFGDARSEQYQDGDIPIRTLGDIVFSYQTISIMFLVFAVINSVIIFFAGLYLVFSINNTYVQVAKGLVVLVSSYIWFRAIQEVITSLDLTEFRPSWLTATMLEIGVAVIAFFLCWLFDKLYLRSRFRRVWIDIVGLAFSTIIFLQFINYIINWRIIAIASDTLRPLYMVMSFSMGGIIYVIYALLERYIDDQERLFARNTPYNETRPSRNENGDDTDEV